MLRKQNLVTSVIILAVFVLALACARKNESTFAQIGKQFGFATTTGFADVHCHSWSYTTPLEGWSRTRITLVKTYARTEAIDGFFKAFSNRTDIVEMPETPVVDSTYTDEVPWWNPRQLRTYRYLRCDLAQHARQGRLEAYVGREAEHNVLYLIAYQ